MAVAPGWYPAPDRTPDTLQYWDGTQWTPHRLAAPSGPPPVTGSGMRRVEALFADIWRIVSRAWWPIAAVGAVIWAVWSVAALAAASLLNLGGWADLARQVSDASNRYPEGIPASVADGLVSQAEDLANQSPAGLWVGVAVTVVIAAVVAAAAHAAAVYRLGAQAASGQPAGFAQAWQGIRAGVLRLTGYWLLLGGAVGLLLAAIIATSVIVIGAMPWLGVPLLLIGILCWLAVLLLLAGRFLPGLVAACMDDGSGALAWSWRATSGRFWAVLGRYLLWSIAAGLITSALQWFASGPLAFGVVWAFIEWFPALIVVLGLLTVLLSSVSSSISMLGAVPIWRDLTEDPQYRAINSDGTPAVR